MKELDSFWTKVFGADGNWLYMQLEHATDIGINDEVPEDAGRYERFPEVEVVGIKFLPEWTNEVNSPEPYFADHMSYEVVDVDYKSMRDYTQCAGRSTVEELYELAKVDAEAPMPVIVEHLPMLMTKDKQFFVDRLKWLAWGAGAERTPDGYTHDDIMTLLYVVTTWRSMDACERAELIYSYRGGDAVGYGDGCYESFAEACIAAGLDKVDADDDAEWELGADMVEPFGPECSVCGNPIYPVSRHSTDHYNYEQEQAYEAECERERLAEQAMDNVFDGD